jgi:hypothetical protein
MQHRLAHRVGRSSQATTAAVDKFMSASHTEFLTTPAAQSNIAEAWESLFNHSKFSAAPPHCQDSIGANSQRACETVRSPMTDTEINYACSPALPRSKSMVSASSSI